MKKEIDYDLLWNTPYLGNNRLVAVAIKTTGPDSKLHEIIQICVFPLNHNFELGKDVIPFYSDILPVKGNVDLKYVRKDKYNEILLSANSGQVVAELFDKWMEEKIRLEHNKKLLPLVYNWAGQRQFIKNWLGPINFEYYFSERYRDILSVALFCNDYNDMRNNDVPYLKTTLVTLARTLRIPYDKHGETILQCKAISETYISLMRRF
jgi:hypothetical protein